MMAMKYLGIDIDHCNMSACLGKQPILKHFNPRIIPSGGGVHVYFCKVIQIYAIKTSQYHNFLIPVEYVRVCYL